VRAEVWTLDSDLPLENIRSLEQIRADSVAPERFQTLLLGLFATLAIILAATGIYGVLSYAVAQRTGEIGIRISMGAETADVLRLVVGQGLRLTLAGVAVGLVGAFLSTRMISSLLFDVSPSDPLTFGAVAGTLVLVALAACTIPALRASRVDPVHALRAE
jgi:ABC-type antimicrobial peptide transport system permease subunit